MTYLPLDNDNNPIPALRLKSGGAHHITTTATAARNGTAFSAATQVISIYATGPVYLKFGDNTVTATSGDHYFPSGVYYDFALGGDKTGHFTHVSALRVTDNCDVYISEKE